jgi:hypothetical protein
MFLDAAGPRKAEEIDHDLVNQYAAISGDARQSRSTVESQFDPL